MKRVILGLLGLALLACEHVGGDPSAAVHRSAFGFKAEIPAAWLAVDAGEVAQRASESTPEALENIDPELLAEFEAALRGGEVEIFFRPGEVAGGFIDNVSLRATPGGFPPADRDVLASCDVLTDTLSAAYGRPVALSVCEVRRVAEQRSLYVEAAGAVPGIHSLQYLIERPSGSLIVVTGTTLTETLPTMRGEIDAMVGSLELE